MLIRYIYTWLIFPWFGHMLRWVAEWYRLPMLLLVVWKVFNDTRLVHNFARDFPLDSCWMVGFTRRGRGMYACKLRVRKSYRVHGRLIDSSIHRATLWVLLQDGVRVAVGERTPDSSTMPTIESVLRDAQRV